MHGFVAGNQTAVRLYESGYVNWFLVAVGQIDLFVRDIHMPYFQNEPELKQSRCRNADIQWQLMIFDEFSAGND
jgi:hypothetical protein